jgi:putative nucleotidyltransferase with HDIG domain
MGAGLVTGLLTGIAVVGLLPVLESLFKRTTDITLLELTDYNHPLLRRMQLEAPGTYHHSLIVAQLAENACSAIGANPLLARVCALFHDIGKVLHPAYFSENQRDRGNPHDHHDPVASARIIKQHVAQGLALAQKHQLPRAVRDVIEQHHGTTLVRFFYERARSQPAPSGDQPLNEAEFRYDGPRPQFKESAIISLADGVEATSRSLRQATPEQLKQLIDRIVRDRLNDGQLDEAPLTFAEVAKVKESFLESLINMLHGRVAYPPETPEPVPAKA